MTGAGPDDGAVADGASTAERHEQTIRTCPTTAAILACGQACIVMVKGVPITLFAQPCH